MRRRAWKLKNHHTFSRKSVRFVRNVSSERRISRKHRKVPSFRENPPFSTISRFPVQTRVIFEISGRFFVLFDDFDVPSMKTIKTLHIFMGEWATNPPNRVKNTLFQRKPSFWRFGVDFTVPRVEKPFFERKHPLFSNLTPRLPPPRFEKTRGSFSLSRVATRETLETDDLEVPKGQNTLDSRNRGRFRNFTSISQKRGCFR